MPEVTREDLWIFAFEQKKVFYKDFSKYCNNHPTQDGKAKLSRQTMTDYIEDLVKEEKLSRGFDDSDRYRHYFVPENKNDEVKALIDQRLFDKEFESLSASERALLLDKKREKENKKILKVVALDGPLFIPEIAEKTGFTKTKISETLWGPLIHLGLFSSDKNSHLPVEEREYSLNLCGLYRALRENMDKFDVIVGKWGYLHPFIFSRISQLNDYGLVETLKDFIMKIRPRPSIKGIDITQKEIEDYLIAFIVSGFNHRYIRAWLKFFHKDKLFRERFESRLKEAIVHYQSNIRYFQNVLEIVGPLGLRSEPNWEEMKWNLIHVHSLEMFLHFPWFYPEESSG